MENKNKNSNKNQVGGSSSSTNFDQLFGPKDPFSSSSSSSSIFGSIFPPPSSTYGGSDARKQDVGCKNYGPLGNKGERSGAISDKNYQNESAMEPSNYYTSSIYYGGQENYSPKTRTTESHQNYKKDSDDDDDPNGNNPNSASRGNWWQGSLYY